MDDLNELNFDDVWKIVTLFYEDQLYTNDSVHSFDKFILNINNIPIPNIEIESEKDNNGISKIHKIQFVNYYIGKAMLNEDDPNKKSIFLSHPKNKNKAENISIVLPHENRERCLTYSIPIYYDIIHDIYKKNSEGEIELFNHKMNNKVCIGNIPLPTGSEWCNLQLIPDLKHECPYSKSGTFIINGNDKNVIPQGRMEYNSIFISKKIITKPMLVAQVRCLAENDFSDPSVIYINFKTYKGKDDMFKLKFPYINYDINVVVIFR